MTSVLPAHRAGDPDQSAVADSWNVSWVPDDGTSATEVSTVTAPSARPTPEPESAPPGRTFRSRMVDWFLNVLALFGVICIVLVIWAYVGNYTLIMYKTGSMAPTIPQGSLSLVHKIPASEIKVGDVVTVDREGNLKPVTHRVTSVTPLQGDVVRIEMKGDANPNPDPAPYEVTEVRKVVWSAPGLAKQVVWLSNPIVLGSITIVMSLLVLWAFWPRTKKTVAPRE